MARIYPLPEVPVYLQDLIDRLYRIRDYHGWVADRPTSDQNPTNVMLKERYDDLQLIKTDWFNRAKAAIRNIRGVRNNNPLWTIDDILPPEPDPIDQYYYDAGSFYRTKDPNPTQAGLPPDWTPPLPMHMNLPGGVGGGGPTPLLIWPVPRPPRPRPPWPPWPPLPPPPPPPVFWRPPAEEAYTYVYALYYLVDYYIADMQLAELDFQYWGYYFAELLKNLYMLDSFWLTQKNVSDYLMPYLSRLDADLPLVTI